MEAFDKYSNRLESFINKGDVEWQAFIRYWKVKNPEPERKFAKKKVVSLGLKFWLVLGAAVGAFFLSAFRVAERFNAVAVAASGGTQNIFSIGETISAVLAVNMAIFALAIVVAYTKGKMSEESNQIGLWTAIAISGVAGLGQAFKGLGLVEWTAGIDLLLAFVMGVGVTALEYFTGDLLGVELVRYKNEKEQAHKEFVDQQTEFDQEFVAEHKHWLSAAKGQFGLFIANFKKFSEEQEELEALEQVQEVKQKFGKTNDGSVENMIVQLLSENLQRTNELLGVTDLTKKLAELYGITREQEVQEFVRVKKGYVSTVRKQFIRKLEENA